jgi:hypothetical protein
MYTHTYILYSPTVEEEVTMELLRSTTWTDGKPFDDDDDVYLDKLQTRGVKKTILYM